MFYINSQHAAQQHLSNSQHAARGDRARNNVIFKSSQLRSSRLGSTSTDLKYDEVCDVLVLGSSVAGRSVASLLAAQGISVILSDQALDRKFVPNYGVWKNEWEAVCQKFEAMGVQLSGGAVGNAVDREWQVTDCYFGGSFGIPTEKRLRLDRPYCRVDKNALRETLTTNRYKNLYANHFSRAVGVNIYEPAGSLVHDGTGSTIQLMTKENEKLTIRSKLILDCTGHETKLVLRETRDPYVSPGFQIAYGILVDVEQDNPDALDIGPYAKDAMTLFDYRTDHFDESEKATQDKVASAPTFMYVMPLKDNQVFFEETSLVARPAVSFQECKDRCERRLEHLGIKVTKIYEEEFCYIPMGGALPTKDQRILALGGSASMVHPSTGYHLCRCLMGAADLASAVVDELRNGAGNPDRAAAAAYHSLWTPENIRQRNFAVFGGEFLMKQNVEGLRGFFDGFFRLPMLMWAGFLAGWPGLPDNEYHDAWLARMWYGVLFLSKLPLSVAADMVANIVGFTVLENLSLMQSVTPFLGQPDSYEYKVNTDIVGDVAAKVEARKMIMESKVEEVVPVAFDQTTTIAALGPALTLQSTKTTSVENESVTSSAFE
ncbi:hypothetical protein ACA910_002420 [Epithemia clementina (nom. ined.)]